MSSDEKEEEVRLEWKDYVAFVIAMFETVLLPIVIIIIGLVVAALVLRLL